MENGFVAKFGGNFDMVLLVWRRNRLWVLGIRALESEKRDLLQVRMNPAMVIANFLRSKRFCRVLTFKHGIENSSAF